jgi:hypothetical protein
MPHVRESRSALRIVTGSAALALVTWQALPRASQAEQAGQASEASQTIPASADPLPSWNDGPAKTAILKFVARTTTLGSTEFLPVEDRIATFDNDGTLWPEQPVVQAAFVAARVKAVTAKNPALAERQPFKALLTGDTGYLVQAGEPAAVELLAATSANMSDDAFDDEARRFFTTARHPRFGVPFTQLAYRPMVELLQLLRRHQWKTFLCSGGGEDFMRLVSQQMYGIPPEQVIGSELKKQWNADGQRSGLWRKAAISVINDKETKPVNIDAHIGKRPLFAAGNVRSGGDIAMLTYSGGSPRPSLQLLINHDDAAREFAYGEKDGASLAAARAHGFHVVSMKNDWRAIFFTAEPGKEMRK